MSIKLIVMDMDGTLLNSKKEISQRTIDKLIELQEQGVRLVLASGRVKPRLESFAKQLKMEQYGGYLIEANGSAVYSYQDQTREIIRSMSHDEANEVFQFIKKEYPNNEIMIMADVNAYVYLPKGKTESSYFNMNNMESLKNREVFYIDDVYSINEMFFKVCTYDEPNKIIEIADKVKDLGTRYWSGRTMPFWLEVTVSEVSKGNALSRIMKDQFNREEVYAFGDGENDISMLKIVQGVAMKNAIDSVKKYCKYETDSCDEDGIVKFIERIM